MQFVLREEVAECLELGVVELDVLAVGVCLRVPSIFSTSRSAVVVSTPRSHSASCSASLSLTPPDTSPRVKTTGVGVMPLVG